MGVCFFHFSLFLWECFPKENISVIVFFILRELISVGFLSCQAFFRGFIPGGPVWPYKNRYIVVAISARTLVVVNESLSMCPE